MVLRRHAQQRRRMHRHQQPRSRRQIQEPAAIALDRGRLPGDGARRGGPERHNQRRGEQIDLTPEPLLARLDLPLGWLLVDAPLAAGLVLEVLDSVRHVELPAVDARVGQRAVQDSAGRADERPALEVLTVARLLADQHDRRARAAFAEHRLRGVLPQRAGAAVRRVPSQAVHRVRLAAGYRSPADLRSRGAPSCVHGCRLSRRFAAHDLQHGAGDVRRVARWRRGTRRPARPPPAARAGPSGCRCRTSRPSRRVRPGIGRIERRPHRTRRDRVDADPAVDQRPARATW